MRGDALIKTLGNRGTSGASKQADKMHYQLTDAGRNRAREVLAQSSYFGAFPVMLEAFTAQCEAQSIRKAVISREALAGVAKGLILPQVCWTHWARRSILAARSCSTARPATASR